MEIIIVIILAMAILFGAIIYSAFAWGYVCVKFWVWFILPIFTTLPSLNLYQAMGLVLFISLFHNHNQQAIKKEYKDESGSLGTFILAPWLTLFCGWIIHSIIS